MTIDGEYTGKYLLVSMEKEKALMDIF